MVRKYDAAIDRQREQISKARSQANAAGCGFSLFSRNINQCAGLNATIDRMNANLDSLQAKRAQLAGGGGSRRDRGRILAALDANGCRDDASPQRRAPLEEADRGDDGSANLFDQLFGNDSRKVDTLDQPDDPGEERNIRRVLNQPGIADFPNSGGEFHTTCVRTCDGYFFPMSNAASAGDFERDQKNCESSCPGTEMQVFYSRGMDDDSASMTSSVTGKPYSELPTAYLYKQSNMPRPSACGCNAAQNFQIIGGNPPAPQQSQPEPDASPFIPVPGSKPDPGADPETLANMEGGLDREAIKRLSAKPVTSPVSAIPPDADTALSEHLRQRVYPHSRLKGEANLLVFPNLDSANITLTALRAMMDALHVGPILLGTDKPAHILTPSVTSRGVVNMTALAVVEAAHKAQAIVNLG